MDPLGVLDRLAEQLRRHQFRVGEWVYWLVTLIAGAATGLALQRGATPLALCTGVVVAVAATGIVRWRHHRRPARGGLVVCVFAAPGQEARASAVQSLIVSSLQDKLTAEEAGRVHKVPVAVGDDEREFAISLRRRLRARFLLHGRISTRGRDGDYAVHARVAQPIDRGVIHLDPVTRDVTFEKASWRAVINRLTSASEVIDEAYPLEFTNELEAIVRATAGQLAEDRGDYERAERLLAQALSTAPARKSHQIDFLRVALARAVFEQGRESEAIGILLERSRDESAAPELHRNLQKLMYLAGGPDRSDESRREELRALRAAATHRSDPQLAMTLYNIAMATPDEREAAGLLDELLQSKTHYRDAWYVCRHRGAQLWHEAEEVHERNGFEAARPIYDRAAAMYTRAIRRRPHFRVVLTRRSFDYFRWRTPPLLYYNAADAHQRAGHGLRAWWYGWRGRRRRNRLLRIGHRAFNRRKWGKAAEYFEHVGIVRGDMARTVARTWRAVALKQLGADEQAETLWRETLAEDPGALSWRAVAVLDPRYGLTVEDLPGEEPTNAEEVNELIERLTRETPPAEGA